MSEVTYAIDNLNKTINQFESNVNVHVSTIRDGSINVEQATRSIYEQLTKFRQDMEHGELKQLAHENIIRIEQIIKERFGSYETIRKTVLGVVRDFDINLVRNTTIQELSAPGPRQDHPFLLSGQSSFRQDGRSQKMVF